eukprot:CAMPEP_0184731428 /NCGR_PEP_ID=MMETSP0314-20130426/50863_1 /TAXON_ID=38298 /ORGANISM="Rhodella maculata, Strain CCMP 736" /LENGTH=208 /DNA_ID=CAMNT_0027197817 /DNA_START=18 /DNA_END=644 /DNA_ORIENTATION=-
MSPAAFVTTPHPIRAYRPDARLCTRPATAPRAPLAHAPVTMNLPGWKDYLSGGFPGGEAFFKKWIADGMTGDVPSLEKESQPSAGDKVAPPAPAPAPARPVTEWGLWKTPANTAGGFPGGEAFFKQWVESGFKDAVPGTDYNGIDAANAKNAASASALPAPPAAKTASAASAPAPAAAKPSWSAPPAGKSTMSSKGNVKITFDPSDFE